MLYSLKRPDVRVGLNNHKIILTSLHGIAEKSLTPNYYAAGINRFLGGINKKTKACVKKNPQHKKLERSSVPPLVKRGERRRHNFIQTESFFFIQLPYSHFHFSHANQITLRITLV